MQPQHFDVVIVGVGFSGLTAARDLGAAGRSVCVLEATATHEWVNDEWSKGTWTTFRAGQISAYEPYLAAHEGRVHFAGAHTAHRWPGFIDGAIDSGRRAAQEVLERL